jgi:hypothetical protein
MTREQFIAITGPEDAEIGHIPLVAEHMDGRLMVVDPVPAVVAGEGLSFAINSSGDTTCVYGDTPLDNVAAVWDRRPTPVTADMFEPVHPRFRRYGQDAVRWHTRQLNVQFPNALWVSDRFAVARAEHKAVQLAEAAKLRFNVPDTLITSDPAAAKAFVARHPATIIKGYRRCHARGRYHVVAIQRPGYTRYDSGL